MYNRYFDICAPSTCEYLELLQEGMLVYDRSACYRDPKPQTSNLPKVVWRGYQRCLGARGPKACCCTGAREGCAGAKEGCIGARDSPETIWSKHVLHPPLTTLGNFEFSYPWTRHTGSMTDHFQEFSKATRIGSLPSENPAESRRGPQGPAETLQNPRSNFPAIV